MESQIVEKFLGGFTKRVITQTLFETSKVISCKVYLMGFVVFSSSETYPLTMSDKLFYVSAKAAKNAVEKIKTLSY